MKKAGKILICIGVIIVLAVVIYPKHQDYGGFGGGLVGPGAEAYREEYKCLGYSYNFSPQWPDFGVSKFCYGIRYGEQCYLESYSAEAGRQKESAECTGQFKTAKKWISIDWIKESLK